MHSALPAFILRSLETNPCCIVESRRGSKNSSGWFPLPTYTPCVYEWDENKRLSNLAKHGLDFADADLVYENPDKLTLPSLRKGEERWLDLAIVATEGLYLALAYQLRGYNTRVISLRRASRKERQIYDNSRTQQPE